MANPVTVGAVDRSIQLMGLLGVCAHAASTLDTVSNMGSAEVTSSLANCLELALRMAEQQHDLLQSIHQDQGRPE